MNKLAVLFCKLNDYPINDFELKRAKNEVKLRLLGVLTYIIFFVYLHVKNS